MAFDLAVNTTAVQSASSDGPSCAKPSSETNQERPKPCCVCIDEKVARDECMLMSVDGQSQCAELIQNYKACMKGFGFNV
ncbi:cytochrome C oxidase copper chaperone-domain-containing protein [Lipomyces chichibuensis]|uniref:cytochrome C oxidase copper chaperone-domain-containing protein n=1 Tax=Lipomyces chichibuensis TaxID=1546026 RepID=UPI003343601F